MNVIDLDGLLQPVSSEAPCGDSLALELYQLTEAVKGEPSKVDPEQHEEPDWASVKIQALELLSRSKDLNAAVILLKALTQCDGFPGLADGLGFIRGLLERYWQELHPQLDEDNDLTERTGIIQPLCDLVRDGQDYSDMSGMLLHDIRRIPLISFPPIGQFSLKDIKVAAGRWRHFADPGGGQRQHGEIEAAFQNCELESLQTTAFAVQRAKEEVAALEKLLEQYSADYPPKLEQLAQELQDIQTLLAERLSLRGVAGVHTVGEQAVSVNSVMAPDKVSTPGEIQSRDDVVRTLDRLCDYYARNEPSSPVPLLLQRAKRLVAKDFMEILRDLAPDGVNQAELISGMTPSESSNQESSSW